MKCSNCGKEIPFTGNVCPYCKADKSGDQIVKVMMTVGAIIGGIVGFGGLHAVGVDSVWASFAVMAVVTIVFAQLGRRAAQHQEATKKAATAGPVTPVVTARKCPHCAEQIQAEAKVCRFCQRDVA